MFTHKAIRNNNFDSLFQNVFEVANFRHVLVRLRDPSVCLYKLMTYKSNH